MGQASRPLHSVIWLMAHGSWIKANDSRPMAKVNGSCVTAQLSRPAQVKVLEKVKSEAAGSWDVPNPMATRSSLDDSRLGAEVKWAKACGSRPLAKCNGPRVTDLGHG